jgi:hypothetical protein
MDTFHDKRQDVIEAIQRVGNYVQELSEHRQLNHHKASNEIGQTADKIRSLGRRLEEELLKLLGPIPPN